MPGEINNETILAAVNQVVAAINGIITQPPTINVNCTPDVNVNCGNGIAASGPNIDPPPVEGQPPGGGGPGGGGVPPGFEGDESEYNYYKCAASNYLVDAYLDHIKRWADNIHTIAENVTGDFDDFTTVLFLASPFLALLLPTAVPILVSYAITLAIASLAISAILYLYRQWLIDHKGDIVCALFEAQDVSSARAALMIQLDPTGIPEFPNGFVEINVDALFTNSVLNILFENYAAAEVYQSSINCQTCECDYTLEFGNDAPHSSNLLGAGDLTVDGQSRVLTAVQSGNGNYYIMFKPVAGCCNFVLTIDAISITPVSGSVVFWHNSENCADQTAIPYRTTAQVNDQFIVGKLITFASQPTIDGGPFTITVTLEEII